MNNVLQQLSSTIQQRIDTADQQQSYVATLSKAGLDKILEKVGEEAIETILAAKNAQQSGNNEKLVHETADLMFHTLIMLNTLGSNIDEVLSELQRRMGTSGLEEKKSRRINK